MEYRDILEKYREETNTPLTPDEIENALDYVFPIRSDDGSFIGVFGFNVVPSDTYKNVAVVRLVYVLPEKRRSFKPVARTIFTFLLEQGYTTVEVHTTGKINNWMKNVLHSKPYAYVHLGQTEDYVNRLKKRG